MRGYHNVSLPLHREHELAARDVLAKQRCVDEGTVRYDGSRLHFGIDRAMLPAGDAPSLELVIVREIEKAVRP